MKTVYTLMTMIAFATAAIPSGSQFTIQGLFPFDTIVCPGDRGSFYEPIKIERYNMSLDYRTLITVVVPPTPFSASFSYCFPINKGDFKKPLNFRPRQYAKLVKGIIGTGGVTATVDSSVYYYIDSIVTPGDKLYIYPKKVWLAAPKSAYTDSIHLQFNYIPGIPPVSVQPQSRVTTTPQASSTGVSNEKMYTIQGVRVNPAKASTGVFIRSNRCVLLCKNSGITK